MIMLAAALGLVVAVPAAATAPDLIAAVVDYEPSLSTDGRQIAFISNRAGPLQLHVMSAGGATITRLSTAIEDDAPAWSPDGTQIAFTTTTIRGESRLMLIGAKGGAPRQLSATPGNHLHPNWSPDGRRLLFGINAREKFELRTISADGTGETVFAPGVEASFASWSPDGRRIVARRSFGANSDIVVLDSSGRPLSRVTRNPAFDGWPSWSPDGKHIVFARERGDAEDSADILVVDADGRNERTVAGGPGRKTTPRWSADGQSIVYSNRIGREVRLWRVAIGSQLARKRPD